jgi:hypothetical protein
MTTVLRQRRLIAAMASLAATVLCACAMDTVAQAQLMQTSTRVCQLTGQGDRTNPAQWTAEGLGSAGMSFPANTANANNADMGFSYESDNGTALNFLFGDTWSFNVDKCEPSVCGTLHSTNPPTTLLNGTICTVVTPPSPFSFEAWPSQAAFDADVAEFGDGWDHVSRGAVSAATNLDNCLSLQVERDPRPTNFVHNLTVTTWQAMVSKSFQVSGPRVGQNANDRAVVGLANHFVVPTTNGQVWVHRVIDNIVRPGHLVGGTVPASTTDKAYLAMGNKLLVVRSNGRVYRYDAIIDGNGDITSFQSGLNNPLPNQAPTQPWETSLVGVSADAVHITANQNTEQIIVTNTAGGVFVHNIKFSEAFPVKLAYQLGGGNWATPSSARFFWLNGHVVSLSSTGNVRLGVVSDVAITMTRNTTPEVVPDALVATQPGDTVVPLGDRIYVTSRDYDRFRPTRINHQTMPRQAGAFSGFVDGNIHYAFMSQHAWEPPIGAGSCPAEGCSHDNNNFGRGKLVLSRAVGGPADFEEVAGFSQEKFIFASPEVVTIDQAQELAAPLGLSPRQTSERVVVLWGAGREKRTNVVSHPVDDKHPLLRQWHNSFPYLAIARIGDVTKKRSEVHVHSLRHSSLDAQVQYPTRAPFATLPTDKWVLGRFNQLLVINEAGDVHLHQLNTDACGSAICVQPSALLNGNGIRVGASPEDKWVMTMGRENVLVITKDGRVFRHRVTSTVEPAVALVAQAGQKLMPIGTNPRDKWVLAVRNRLLVVTHDGRVFAHTIVDNATSHTISEPVELSTPFPIASGYADRRLVAVGNRLLDITTDGTVRALKVNLTNITYEGVLNQRATAGTRVAANLADRWVVSVGDPDLDDNTSDPNAITGALAVVPYFLEGWKYYRGMSGGVPQWGTLEAQATPIAPFGAEPGGPEYHRCLSYFSARRFDAAHKYVMMYHCDCVPPGAFPSDANNGPTGVYIRTASTPWGPWTSPQLVFDRNTGGGYCNYMYSEGSCPPNSPNPYEHAKRALRGNTLNPVGGVEYAPLLVPSGFFKSGPNNEFTLYWAMSTWNPYQVVLMKTTGELP